jgi:DNA-binding transcriptional ArsR family regulator
MGQKFSSIGQGGELQLRNKDVNHIDFVLEKTIFHNIFEKDIRRAYIYKKAEGLGKAIHLITPAFAEFSSLKNRIEAIAIGLVDAALLPISAARGALSRELLALSSILSIARTGGFLSHMNSDIIAREAHLLLQEVSAYEEPRLSLEETPSLSHIAKSASAKSLPHKQVAPKAIRYKGHIKDIDAPAKDRQEAILSLIASKGKVGIKDISIVIRGVSEKTIQRELAALISSGKVTKEGERRWSMYSLA